MKKFMNQDFLLDTEVSRELFHQYAAKLPIIDYHNHLPPADIASDRRFDNMTAATLEGDHYKWRAMRTNGIDEQLITGDADPRDKWRAWAKTMPMCARNPLFHWQHLELQRYFGTELILNEKSADSLYDRCSEMLQQEDFSSRGLLRQMNVEALCTTDDPVDTLLHHKICIKEISDFKALPTFRPDRIITTEDVSEWKSYISALEAVSKSSIETFDQALNVLKARHDYFHENGCRLSDHGLARPFFHAQAEKLAPAAFAKLLAGISLNTEEDEALKCAFMLNFGRWNAEKDWTMQLHMGPMRNNSTRQFKRCGRDAGFDSMNDAPIAEKLSRFLDGLDIDDSLPKTILYNLNPKDNAVLATMCGNFQDGTIAGKIQFGSGWWFLDQLDGMEKQLNTLSSMGLISRFVGMLTDSRSFLSFPRHEYFRRLVCQLFGRDVENGLLPNDMQLLSSIIEGICYKNAKNYFKF